MTAEVSQSIRLEIDSDLRNTTLMAMAVRGLCTMTSLSETDVNRVELCLVEIVNNAIEHAYNNESDHTVEAMIRLTKQQLQIMISDWGTPIPDGCLSVNEPGLSDPELPETLMVSGRGLYLVTTLMDSVEYSSDQGKNSLTMIKALTS